MSRSKQLGGFSTSGVFGFRQTQAHAPPVAKLIYKLPTARPALSALSAAAFAATSISSPIPQEFRAIGPHRPCVIEQSLLIFRYSCQLVQRVWWSRNRHSRC